MPKLLECQSEQDAVEWLYSNGCTDGLPVVVPTPERIQAMLSRVDLDGDLSLGEIGPKHGSATCQLVAAAAVMAGCLPDYFPVVVAAVKAVCRPEFDITEVNQTTHCVTPLIVVNGPARFDCGPIASGAGILGPGNRASATIGRALSLVLINIGGRENGVTDLAVYSNPGKFAACFAEAEEASPYDPYHQFVGFEKEDSVVTLFGVEAPHSFILEPLGDKDKDAQRLIECVAGVIATPGSTHPYCGGRGRVVVVLNPEHAEMLYKAGYRKQDIQKAIQERAYLERSYADRIFCGLNSAIENDLEKVPAIRNPEQIIIFVAGGLGTYSMALPTWAYAPHGSMPVSEKVEVFPFCESPLRQ